MPNARVARRLCRAGFGATLAAVAWLTTPGADAGTARVDASVLAPVRAFAAAFNAQGAYPEAAFTRDCSVLDDFAPYVWRGDGAPRRWYASLTGTTPLERRAMAATHARIVFDAPQFTRRDRERAYLVVPGTLTLTLHGNVETQHGRWTLAEVRGPSGWRIASQAWAIVDGFAD
ncbi:MAG: hypothetical protein IAI50_18610 [Candidatus Eremiobacteraeota bacterium]|nr:hypothetical protein [Candidatus Eremiobacteraeota bacterium]